jgi:hypothetical protein
MCIGGPSTPSVPAPPPAPQAPQDPQLSDLAAARKQRMQNQGMAGGTLLTGPSGIENNQLNTGRGSLLGS